MTTERDYGFRGIVSAPCSVRKEIIEGSAGSLASSTISSTTAGILTSRTLRVEAQMEEVCVDSKGQSEGAQDEVILAHLQGGDQDAFGCLFQRYARLLRNIAARILRDTAEAEDLVQDLFLFIQRKCAIFDSSKSSARSWIVQMAYQRAIERRRYLASRNFYAPAETQGAVERLVGKPTGESDYSPEAVFGRNGLERALRTLSEDQRETIRLYFFEGYTLAEIGERLGQPLGNARNHYYRGLNKLRKEMFRNSVRPVQPYGK